MNGSIRSLVLVNAPASSGLGERGEHVGVALGGARVLFRETNRLRDTARFCAAVLEDRPDYIYGIDNAVCVFAAAFLGRILCGSRLLLDTGDAIGPLRAKTSWLGGVAAHALERFSYVLAWMAVARSHGLAERIRKLSTTRTIVIPDGCDLKRIPNVNGELSRSRWHCGPNTLVLGVLGSANWNPKLRWCYGRDVIEAIARSRRTDLMGVLVVRGDGVPRLRELANSLGVSERIVFDEPLAGYDVYQQIQGFDVALSTQTDDEVGRCRTTGKLVQYIASGKYVLVSRVGEAARLLPEEMLVPYSGSWDDDYFSLLADRVDKLPTRAELSAAGMRLRRELAATFDYARIRQQLQHLNMMKSVSHTSAHIQDQNQ